MISAGILFKNKVLRFIVCLNASMSFSSFNPNFFRNCSKFISSPYFCFNFLCILFNIIVSVPQEVLNYSLLYRWQWKVKLANFVFYFLTSCSMPMQFYTDKFFHFTTMSLLTRNIFINETDIILPFPKAAKFCLSIFKFICNIIQTFFVVHLCTCLLQRHRRLFGLLLSRSREGW